MYSLASSVVKLWSWLETWMDEYGGIHGYVVYHHADNLKILSPDTWTQSTCVLGLLKTYQISKNIKWLNLAERLSEYLVKTYIKKIHVFRNSNFDRKPLGQPALEGNALASYALLETAKQSHNEENRRIFIEIAEDNIFNYILNNWEESIGAFGSIYHGATAHIHNKNSLTVMALLSLSELEHTSRQIDIYASQTGKFILRHQVKEGAFAGAYPYADDDKNYRTIYSLITCLGLIELYRKTNETCYLQSVINAIRHLSNFLDRESGLICHFHRFGYPQWVADTSLLLMVINRLPEAKNQIIDDTKEVLDKLLSKQYPNGAFPLSIGFEDLWYKKRLPSRPDIRRWRDVLPTPGLNSWIFWGLSDLLTSDTSLPNVKIDFPIIYITDQEEWEGPYKITEHENHIMFETYIGNRVVGIFEKRAELANICQIKERGDYWTTIDSIMRYPEPLRRIILGIPNIFYK